MAAQAENAGAIMSGPALAALGAFDPEFGAVFPMGNPIDPLQYERQPEETYDPLRHGF